MKQYYLFVFYVPPTQLSTVKNALFAAGAGNYGRYSHCSWETPGRAQYMNRPKQAGVAGNVMAQDEVKVEVMVPEEALQAVVDALMAKHPHDEPFFYYQPIGIGFAPNGDENEN